MSDPNPPEQPSFNRPAGGDPTTPLPSSQPTSPRARRRPPPPPPMAPAAPSGGPGGMSSIPGPAKEGAGFFPALFDFSFTNFVTPNLVRFVYLLATVALALTGRLRDRRLRNSVGTGLGVLVLGPIFVVICLAVIRIALEFYLSVVRMSEDVHKRLPQA